MFNGIIIGNPVTSIPLSLLLLPSQWCSDHEFFVTLAVTGAPSNVKSDLGGQDEAQQPSLGSADGSLLLRCN